MHLIARGIVNTAGVLLMSLWLLQIFEPIIGNWQTFEIVSVRNLNRTGEHHVDVELKRIQRNLYGLTGTMHFGRICDFDVDVLFLMNSFGRFVSTAYNIPRQPANDVYNNWYVKVLMQDVGNFSDLPQLSEPLPEQVCRVFENQTFHLTKYVFDPKPIPSTLMQGIYKGVGRIIDGNDQIVAGVEIIFRLS